MSDGNRTTGKVEVMSPKDLVPKGESSMATHPFAPDSFNLASTMKERLGVLGRLQISAAERRIAREEIKQVLKNELRAQTELMLHRARLDLDFYKKVDQAAHSVRVTKVEQFLVTEEAKMQHVLNDLIDKFEDGFTDQYMATKDKLRKDLGAGRIDQSIHDMRSARAYERYESAMNKSLNDMNMIIDNHKTNLANTLKAFTN
ncbi:hypothetical protein ACQ86E_18970 [Bradyrhizobium betae]|uniref:hypothetical protein n=1 Tax=Bradyrhizobium betae TaxID=244734 RepID=UPI003D675A06